jgi:uncharacterized protein YjbI with pentapeptide repeats
LTDASFEGANLSGAILRYTDLTRTNFTAANLTGADLTGARNLTMAQLQEAIVDEKTKLPKLASA